MQTNKHQIYDLEIGSNHKKATAEILWTHNKQECTGKPGNNRKKR